MLGEAGSLINAWRQHARVQITVATGTMFDVHLAIDAAPPRVTGGGICAVVPCRVDFAAAHQLVRAEHQNFTETPGCRHGASCQLVDVGKVVQPNCCLGASASRRELCCSSSRSCGLEALGLPCWSHQVHAQAAQTRRGNPDDQFVLALADCLLTNLLPP